MIIAIIAVYFLYIYNRGGMDMLWNRRKLLIMCSLANCLTALQATHVYETIQKEIPSEDELEWEQVREYIPMQVQQYIDAHDFEEDLQHYKELNIELVTIEDELYPERLREIYLPPIVLFIKGDVSLLNTICLGIVGARQHTFYGEEVLNHLLPVLTKKLTIISGMAKGIDGYAHYKTLKEKGKTIAVVGTGLDITYPSEHGHLQQVIEQRGCLVSEYPLGSPALKFHFPYRNRIIAGLSHGVLVVEAKKRSGSLITANVALQENRLVFAVPGSIFSSLSCGTNELIQAGAKAVLTSEDILEDLQNFL